MMSQSETQRAIRRCRCATANIFFSGEATMRNSSRAVTLAVLLTAAAAHAAGQGNLQLPQRTQDNGAVQKPDVQNPNTPNPNTPNPNTPNPSPNAQPTVTVFDRLEVQGILGKEVRSGADENMGRIVDVVVDRSGQVRAAIIDFGGFLGVGNRKVAVAWNALRFPPDPKDPKKVERIGLDLTREQVQAAPEYKEDKPVVVLGASGGLESLPFP
jgi:PRC-barrel domain